MVGKVVGRRLIFLQEIFPLLVVIISEHVESLLNQTDEGKMGSPLSLTIAESFYVLRSRILLTVITKADLHLFIAVTVCAAQSYGGVSV